MWLRNLLAALLLVALFTGCDQRKPLLEQIKSSGELIVITRNSPTTYFVGPDNQPAGFEYDMAKLFADSLSVELKLIVVDNFVDILPMISKADAHIATAGLTVTEARKKYVRFSPSYQEITQQLVYRLGTPRPHSIEDIIGGDLEVIAGSSHVENLRNLREQHQQLSWRETSEMESEELLTFVWENMIDYTIADSNEVLLNQRYYPELRVAFDLSKPEQLAWAMPLSDDDSLYTAVNEFIKHLQENGQLAQLMERHYGHVDSFDYVGTRAFINHYYQRLPKFQDNFVLAADETGFDWQILAAIAYQESHWNPKAVSPTGVRGIMMLTQDTAKHIGIKKRTDPTQSITGGSRYLMELKERIPDRIPEPDRTWMAVAAYNVGYGHLEDARIITEHRGFDPDKWLYVKENLPLLRKKAWYKKTRHGYARGDEPVRYVENIRSYYDLLIRLTKEENEDQDKPAVDIKSLAL
jgi:membrane-bound lytic murein transglycosylase F